MLLYEYDSINLDILNMPVTAFTMINLGSICQDPPVVHLDKT